MRLAQHFDVPIIFGNGGDDHAQLGDQHFHLQHGSGYHRASLVKGTALWISTVTRTKIFFYPPRVELELR